MTKPNPICINGLLLFVFFLCLQSINTLAQNNPAGTRNSLPVKHRGYFTPGGLFDTVFDDKGNKYPIGALSANDAIRTAAGGPVMSSLVAAPCSPGYFKMYLDSASGMVGPVGSVQYDRMRVLCQVLTDVSNLINSPCTATGQKVNVLVQPSFTSGTYLGLASGIYSLPPSDTRSGIADNAAWITINSGHDAFENVTSPLYTIGGAGAGTTSGTTFFHILIQFNFSGSVLWNTDLTANPGPGAYDLYTVLLHEVLHSLGFVNLIAFDGRSIFDYSNPYLPAGANKYQYYSRFDTHLRTQAGAPLITSASTCDPMYQAQFNPSLTPATVLAPTSASECASTTLPTSMASEILYVGSTTQYVYTPGCFTYASSLSHFDDEYNTYLPSTFTVTPTVNEYFVMSKACMPGPVSVYPGAIKRYPKPEERKALCDIGYSVNTTFGDPSGVNLNYNDYGGSPCPGLGVAGINDGITGGTFKYFTTGAPVTIYADSVLINDYGVTTLSSITGSLSCLEVVNGSGSLSATSVPAGGSFNYIPAVTDYGVILLRYLPTSASGAKGNITYIYVYVGTAGCTGTPCNLVSNGDFENTTPAWWGASWPGNVSCWDNIINTSPGVRMYSRGVSTFLGSIPAGVWIPDIHPDPLLFPAGPVHNDHFPGIWFMATTHSVALYEIDAITQPFATPLVTGNSYLIDFWVFVSNNVSPTRVTFAASNGPVVIPALVSTLPAGLTPLKEFDLTPDYSWHHLSGVFTYTSTATATQLTILESPWPLGPFPIDNYGITIGLDDIQIRPLPSVCPFSLPDTFCSASLDLNSYTCGIPGTFSWETIPVTSGMPTISTSNIFNPADALAASIALGHTGRITIRFDYTDASGCAATSWGETQISTCIVPVTDTVCQGSTLTLTGYPAGGTWSSSGAGHAIVSSGGIVTGMALGTENISYTSAYGTAVKTVTVISPPDAITGDSAFCQGTTVALSDATAGGVWSSNLSAVATVDSVTGAVAGVNPGIATITYSIGPCVSTYTVTVYAIPTPITGITWVATGHTVTLTDAIGGGTWSSSTTNATIDSITGVVIGVTAGTSIITYAIGSCMVTQTVTVGLPTATTHPAGVSAINKFSIFPNPTKGAVTIEAHVTGTVTLYSIDGREIQQYTVEAGTTMLKLPNKLAAGTYTCKFSGSNGFVSVVRLVYEVN